MTAPTRSFRLLLLFLLVAGARPALGVTLDEVLKEWRPLETVTCEIILLEREMGTRIAASGIPAEELMRRDINDPSPISREIRRLSERMQVVVDEHGAAIKQAGELAQQLSAEDKARYGDYMRGMVQRCARP
jgi:hypothetical protein